MQTAAVHRQDRMGSHGVSTRHLQADTNADRGLSAGIAIVAVDLGGGHGGVPAQPGAVRSDPLEGRGFSRSLQIQATLPADLQSFTFGADFDHGGFNNGMYELRRFQRRDLR